MIKENRISKYTLYAIGEIILVVIGILIALQINNWNEIKKTRTTELKLLHELKNDLIETKEDLLTDIDKAKQILLVTDSLYQAAMSDNWDQMKISMNYIYETPAVFAKLSAYKSIQAYGVNIVTNDSLRKMMTNFYELHLERVKYSELLIKQVNEQGIKPLLNSFSEPINHCKNCTSLFQLYEDGQDQNKMYHIKKANTKIIHLLKEKFKLNNGLLQYRYKDTKLMIDKMIKTIDSEIKD
tara:strand:- start:816 stop:1535 length:720 start_codon:yes stop_codon:yes gene_type:complete